MTFCLNKPTELAGVAVASNIPVWTAAVCTAQWLSASDRHRKRSWVGAKPSSCTRPLPSQEASRGPGVMPKCILHADAAFLSLQEVQLTLSLHRFHMGGLRTPGEHLEEGLHHSYHVLWNRTHKGCIGTENPHVFLTSGYPKKVA